MQLKAYLPATPRLWTRADRPVAAKLAKIAQGKKLDPVLLVRDGETLHVADGYHRICAAYHTGDDTEVACVLVHTDKGVAV